LIESAKTGDKDAFKQLVEMNESRVAATITGMLGHCSEAEDVGQETFVRFYKALKNFRGESSVGTYLVRIAINLSLNEIKRRKRLSIWFHSSRETELETVADPNPASIPGPHDAQAVVHRALQKLEPKFRSVIVLRLIDGYTTRETADILGLPTGKVLSRLARAQIKLKEIIQPSRKDARTGGNI